MPGYTDLHLLFDQADEFGEEQVIRDVARRSGLLWTCPHCELDDIGTSNTCSHCSGPRPEPEVPPAAQWQCACMTLNVHPMCWCGRTKPGFRRS